MPPRMEIRSEVAVGSTEEKLFHIIIKISVCGKLTHLFVGDESNELVQLVNGSGRHRLDVLLSFFSFSRELWQQLLGYFIADQHNTAVVQALKRSVQATRCRAEVENDVDESFAGIVCALDELLLIEILAPLNDVDSKKEELISTTNRLKIVISTHLSFSSLANSKPSSLKLATVSSILCRDS